MGLLQGFEFTRVAKTICLISYKPVFVLINFCEKANKKIPRGTEISYNTANGI